MGSRNSHSSDADFAHVAGPTDFARKRENIHPTGVVTFTEKLGTVSKDNARGILENKAYRHILGDFFSLTLHLLSENY